MKDTSLTVETQLVALLKERSGSDRVRMACEMFDLARVLVIANIRAQDPGITETDLRLQIFERLYGSDFQSDERDRIVARLREKG